MVIESWPSEYEFKIELIQPKPAAAFQVAILLTAEYNFTLQKLGLF